MSVLAISLLMVCGSVADDTAVQTKCVQVHPAPAADGAFARSNGQQRAVVLIHGFQIKFSNDKIAEPTFRDWQKGGSVLVTALAKEGDVFAFAYGQNVAVDKIAAAPALGENIRQLKKLGYREIVLIGHSAGGVIARHFVEDNPQVGVTKVIQVCTPNGGTSLGKATFVTRTSHKMFVTSLTEDARKKSLAERKDKKIPATIQCVCVVGKGSGQGDGVVLCRCQWTADLQEQGIPALPLTTLHFQAMRAEANAKVLAEVVRQDHPRWSPEQVRTTLETLFATEPPKK